MKELIAYALGKMADDTAMAAVVAHLQGCPGCLRIVESTPPDADGFSTRGFIGFAKSQDEASKNANDYPAITVNRFDHPPGRRIDLIEDAGQRAGAGLRHNRDTCRRSSGCNR